jgi:hypothetical protein
VNSISEKGALQLNIPLRAAWQGSWEPEQIWTVQASEIARWDDYALRGWFVPLTPYCHVTLDWGKYSEEEHIWDPMDASYLLTVFQPREAVKPIWCCANNYVDFGRQCSTEVDECFNVDSADFEDACWDPDDSLPRAAELEVFTCA